MLPTTAEKPRYVAQMFARIAPRYDLMNTLMTFGQDARWRRAVAAELPGGVVLDVGTGTGRLAQAIYEANAAGRVVGVDFTLDMLRRAPRRLRLVGGDALQLPFPNDHFDAVVSGFVVRNLADVERGIDEQIRVLRPGGPLVILETTPGPSGPFRLLYWMYFGYFVPLLGKLIAHDASAYSYLPASTLAFINPSRLACILRERGLHEVRTRSMSLGSVAVTVGRKPL